MILDIKIESFCGTNTDIPLDSHPYFSNIILLLLLFLCCFFCSVTKAIELKEHLLERVKAANDVERMVGEMRQRLREDTPRNDTLVELEERVSFV